MIVNIGLLDWAGIPESVGALRLPSGLRSTDLSRPHLILFLFLACEMYTIRETLARPDWIY
jgi:hypothetical protein